MAPIAAALLLKHRAPGHPQHGFSRRPICV